MPYINKLDAYNKMSLADLKKKYLEHTDVIHQLLHDISKLVELKRTVLTNQEESFSKDQFVHREMGLICKRWECNNPYVRKQSWGNNYLQSDKTYRANRIDNIIETLRSTFEERAKKVNKIFSFMVHTNKLHAIHSFEFIVSKYPDDE